ncbi:MAG: DegT/DnrJ/EryC1/StrS family aminotransferase, partial [Cytophagales bacterium]|nr:DegT/DnrJ/EryC1/StrS family aminotransferase [Cytophaga sp.]
MTQQIPFFTLTHQNTEIQQEVQGFYQQLHAEAWYILGKHLSSFESEYSTYHNIKHTIGVGNGLDALYLSLRALGIGKGDEVIV